MIHCRQTDRIFEDYDLGKYVLEGLLLTFGRARVQIVLSHLEVLGVIQAPGEASRRQIDGRFEFDSGTDRVPLYRVKDGDRDIWLWWTHGGVGKPFDRESFEATVVSLLR